MAACDPAGALRIALPSWVQLLTGVPSNAVTWSPTRSPASLAGDAWSDAVQVPLLSSVVFAATHLLIVPSWVVLSFEMAVRSARPEISAKVSTKAMNERAQRATIRRQ